MSGLRYGSVCSGIEAATVAWYPLGWRPAFFSEIEKFPCAVLAHHYPSVPNYGDMTRFQEWPDVSIDLLVGGTPCQSFSVAGLRKGLADPRGNLALTYLAIAARYRPRWLVWENVPGVLSSRSGRDFGAFLGGLGQLGYGFAWRVLDAQFVRTCGQPFAVPQRRRRVFLVGHLGDWRRAAAVLFDRESLSGNPPPRREAGEGIAPTISARPTGGHGLGTGFDCDGGLIASTGNVAHCLNAGGMGRQDYESETMIAHSLRGEGFDASEDGTGRGWQEDHAYTLEARNKVQAVASDTTQITSPGNYSNPQPGDACHPLVSGAHAPAIATPWAVRRLTPTECERLQGFSAIHQRVRIVSWPATKCLPNANVENRCTIEPNNASNADAAAWWHHADIAEALSSMRHQGLGGRAVLHVRIALDQAGRLGLSVARYGSNASIAAVESVSLPPTLIDDIAQAIALIRPIAEARTSTGRVASRPTGPKTSQVPNGGLLAHLSGLGISGHANGVEMCTDTEKVLSTFITSSHGRKISASDMPWTIWCSFVRGAIAGCIPGGIPNDSFFVVDVEALTDFTNIPWRGKPADQCPDGPRYKALGNSMAVNVMEWIGERIQMAEALT